MVSHVLVVEPYADLRAGIVSVLQRIEYSCDAVGTVRDAVLRLHDHDYDYVVLDIDDPSAPMRDLVTSLDAHANLILITDRDPRELRAGDHAVLRKPFAREELVAYFAH
ncbi:MAG TPA: hypothetical protein VEK11_07150 [Thermoanaerobaculia bacterium]|jgi:DNA-binding response OmpR family regulator|nr:hypothetical protein [Thermoanaerobaculia bacterium]